MRSLRDAINTVRRQLNIDRQFGYLGDGTGEVHDRDNPGKYFVRLPQGNGALGAPVSLPADPNANFPPTDGLCVEVGQRRNRPIILGVRYENLEASGVNPLQLNPLDDQVEGWIYPDKIYTFYATRHNDSDNKPFYASVFPGVLYVSGVPYAVPGQNIDLASFVPASPDHCYAVAFIKTDLALEAFASTPINTSDPLTDVDIQECVAAASAGSLPVRAWELRHDDTLLTVDVARIVDLRPLFMASSGGGGGDVTTASNVGGGAEWFKDLSATVLRFRTFISSHLALIITQNADDITIDLDESAIDITLTTGNLGPTRGGTGLTTYTLGDILYASAANVLSALGIGINGYFLKVVAGIPAWAALAASDIASGILALTRGGTGSDLSATGPGFLKQASSGANVTVAALSSGDIPDISGTYIPNALVNAKGDLIAASADNTPAIRAVGTDGDSLVADSGQTSGLNYAARAKTDLSNLASTAVNTDVIPATDNTIKVASALKKLLEIWTYLLGFKKRSAPSTPASGDITCYADADGNLAIIDEYGQTYKVLRGDHGGYVSFSNDTNNNTLYSRTIKQNSPGTKGIVARYIWGWHQTNGSQATNFTATPNIYLGSTNIFTPVPFTLSANANRHSWAIYILTIEQSGSASGQVCSLTEIYALNQTTANAASGTTATVRFSYTTASEDFSAADKDVALKVQMGTANAQFSVNTFDAEGIGPLYGA